MKRITVIAALCLALTGCLHAPYGPAVSGSVAFGPGGIEGGAVSVGSGYLSTPLIFPVLPLPAFRPAPPPPPRRPALRPAPRPALAALDEKAPLPPAAESAPERCRRGPPPWACTPALMPRRGLTFIARAPPPCPRRPLASCVAAWVAWVAWRLGCAAWAWLLGWAWWLGWWAVAWVVG